MMVARWYGDPKRLSPCDNKGPGVCADCQGLVDGRCWRIGDHGIVPRAPPYIRAGFTQVPIINNFGDTE